MGNVILSTAMPHEAGKQHVVKIVLSVEFAFRRRRTGTGEKKPASLAVAGKSNSRRVGGDR